MTCLLMQLTAVIWRQEHDNCTILIYSSYIKQENGLFPLAYKFQHAVSIEIETEM